MRPRQQVIAFEAALFEANAMCTPALLAGAKAQNVSSCRRTGPIDAQRCSLRFGLKVPSRPREFHPEPLTDSGRDTLASSGSCHRTKAAAFR